MTSASLLALEFDHLDLELLKFVREYFEDVDQTWETFEKTLWAHIANFSKLAKER